MNNLPEVFSVSLPAKYAGLLNSGGYGVKSQTIRLALKQELPGLDPLRFTLASRTIQGPFGHKVSVVPHADFWGLLENKSSELGIDKATLARVALCLFLDRVQKAENKAQ